MYTTEFLKNLYKTLLTIRVFDSQCVKLYRKGLIHGYLHPYFGEEAIAAGACAALRSDDYIVSTHRGHGHCIAKGAEIKYMMAEICGRQQGYCKGRGGSMHIADISIGNLGANGIVGGGIPIGVGAGLSMKLQKIDRVVVIFFSDGASNNGVFAESLNLAAIWDLPVIFMLENNHYAVSTPIEESSRTPDLYKRAEGYMVPACSVDGNDVLTVYEKTKEAAEQCRSGKGPVLIEAKTYRHGGHHVNDAGAYMPRERLEYYKDKDPLKICKNYLTENSGLSDEQIEEIEKTVDQEIEMAVEFAKSCSEPSVEEFLNEIAVNDY